jgi:hypothetical protein
MRLDSFKMIRMFVFFSFLIISLISSGNLFSAEVEKGGYETPGEILASKVLPKRLLRGPNHKIVEEVVTYNGFTNHFIIHTDFGRFKAVGNGMVPIRLQEINAIAKLDKMKKSGSFVNGVKESGGTLLDTTKNLIVHPVDTVSGFPSGIFNIFADAGEVLGQAARGEATIAEVGEKGGKAIAGFSRNKREMAYALGVNRYSNNKVLQEYMNSVTWAKTGGTAVIDFGKMAVSGPAGIAMTAVGSSRVLGRMMRDNSTPGLRRINTEALEGIGITESSIRRFLANRKLTPRHQTAITNSLVSLKRVKNRETLLNHFALRTRSYDDANVNQVVAAMIAGYNQKKSPITEVRTFENVALFRNEKGAYVVTYPVDNFPWTKQTAAKTKKVTAAIPSDGKKELWISGKFSELASRNLKQLGWDVHGHSFERLDVRNPY